MLSPFTPYGTHLQRKKKKKITSENFVENIILARENKPGVVSVNCPAAAGSGHHARHLFRFRESGQLRSCLRKREKKKLDGRVLKILGALRGCACWHSKGGLALAFPSRRAREQPRRELLFSTAVCMHGQQRWRSSSIPTRGLPRRVALIARSAPPRAASFTSRATGHCPKTR